MDELAANPILKWVPAFAGILAAGVTSRLLCTPPLTPSLSLTALLVFAAKCVLGTLLATGLAVWLVGALFFELTSPALRRHVWQTAAALVWFAPLSLLLREKSVWSIVAAVVLSSTLFVTLRGWLRALGEIGAPNDSQAPFAGEMFRPLHGRAFLRGMLPALCIAFFAEAASVAEVTDHLLVAATLGTIFASLAIWSYERRIAATDYDAIRQRRQDLRLRWLVGAAALLTVAGLAPFLRSGSGAYWGEESARAVSSGGESTHERDGTRRRGETGAPGDDVGGNYSGIILWPKRPQFVQLIAPAPLSPPVFQVNSAARTFSVPFNGVFWFFKSPDRRPSNQAQVAYGTPAELNIRSTDGRALLIEAHQNFGTLVDLSCCSKIEIEVQNADRYSGTVSVGLSLCNTTVPGKPCQTLGEQVVSSISPWKSSDRRTAVSDVLAFAIPDSPGIRRFDEVSIVFRLAQERSEIAAKIGIERFVLVPRGI